MTDTPASTSPSSSPTASDISMDEDDARVARFYAPLFRLRKTQPYPRPANRSQRRANTTHERPFWSGKLDKHAR